MISFWGELTSGTNYIYRSSHQFCLVKFEIQSRFNHILQHIDQLSSPRFA